MNLLEAKAGEEYIIQEISTDDEELNDFLFTLGCYSGEPITVVSHLKGGCVVAIKDARYNIDHQLAEAIIVQENDMRIQKWILIVFGTQLVKTTLHQTRKTKKKRL